MFQANERLPWEVSTTSLNQEVLKRLRQSSPETEGPGPENEIPPGPWAQATQRFSSANGPHHSNVSKPRSCDLAGAVDSTQQDIRQLWRHLLFNLSLCDRYRHQDAIREDAESLVLWLQKGETPVTFGHENLGPEWHRKIALFVCQEAIKLAADQQSRKLYAEQGKPFGS